MSQEAHNAKYRRTPKGCLMRAYYFARRRVTLGIEKYAGLAICSREEWYEAFLSDAEFLRLHRAWVRSGFNKWQRPTPDRQDTSIGYVVSNIRWMDYKQNTFRALGV